MSSGDVAFGSFLFSSASGTLLRDGDAVELGQRAARLLRILLVERGETVSKSALLDAAWPGIAVEESNLTVQIAALRKALGLAPSGQSWIATVPREGYRFLTEGEARLRAGTSAIDSDKPAIAVLPFANLSDDREEDFFGLGIAEDLITDLSKVRGLTVIARNSSFAYGRPVDVEAVANDLGVHYVVDGSVRRSADRLRINAELIDATSLNQLWAERFDGDHGDVFGLQDEITRRIVAALSGVLPASDPPPKRRFVDLEAYELYLRGKALVLQSPEGYRRGHPLLERAVTIDPNFAEAYAWLSMSHVHAWHNWGESFESHHPPAIAAAQKAVALDPQNSVGRTFLGYTMLFDGRLDDAVSELTYALQIDPNYADGWLLLSEARTHRGEMDDALRAIRTGFVLNPQPPSWYRWLEGFTLYAMRDHEGAIAALSHPEVRHTGAQRILAASLAQLGRLAEAKAVAAQYLTVVPNFRISHWQASAHHMVDCQYFVDGYLKAGLPM